MNKQTKHDLVGGMIILFLIAAGTCMALDLVDREIERQTENLYIEGIR